MASNEGPRLHDGSGSETEDDVTETSPTPPVTTSTSNKGKGKRKKPEEDSAKKQGTWSEVWDHFSRPDNNKTKAICNYCKKIFSAPSGNGTSNLKKHYMVSCKAYNVWKAANSGKKDQTMLSPEGSNSRLCKMSEKLIREASNEMMVIAELPLSFIEGLGWKHFCFKAKLPNPHSRRTATRDIVEMFVQRKAVMKKILDENKQRLSLTTDIWVAPHTGASYMVITAHFVDAWWQLRKLIIGFKNVYDHKAATISKVLIDCLAEWDIKRIFSITVDNATANSNAMETFKKDFKQIGDDALIMNGDFLHLRCSTHIINLIVKEGLMEIVDSVNAIRNGIYFVRSSTPRLKAFENHVESRRILRGSLPLDVKTRWNSTYLMLEQALKFRTAFDKMHEVDFPYIKYFKDTVEGKKRVGPPVKDDFDSVDRLVKFLIIFYKATLVLSASNTVSSHKLYHAIVTMSTNISQLHSSPGSDEALREKAFSMHMKLSKYWDPLDNRVEMNKLIFVAAVFDPSKKMVFVENSFDKLYGKGTKSDDLKEEVRDILKSLFEEYSSAVEKNLGGESGSLSQQSNEVSTSSARSREEASQTVLGSGLHYESMNDIYRELVDTGGFQEKQNELDLYLKEKLENPATFDGTDYDVLSWWKVNISRFPVLSVIARDILAMQVSSVASESAFSTSGRVLEPSRSCLTHYTIEVLMCLEQWMKCELRLNDKLVKKEQLLADVEVQDNLMREFEPAFTFSAP
ncbi:unnamed protein product [Microthlaspi erraticum]|nr:unnamed protein product [Microthlaspi erraticum]CAA7062152.1 unnamed protein product [Microthlaspi erraticum]